MRFEYALLRPTLNHRFEVNRNDGPRAHWASGTPQMFTALQPHSAECTGQLGVGVAVRLAANDPLPVGGRPLGCLLDVAKIAGETVELPAADAESPAGHTETLPPAAGCPGAACIGPGRRRQHFEGGLRASDRRFAECRAAARTDATVQRTSRVALDADRRLL